MFKFVRWASITGVLISSMIIYAGIVYKCFQTYHNIGNALINSGLALLCTMFATGLFLAAAWLLTDPILYEDFNDWSD